MGQILRIVWRTVIDDFKSIEPFIVFVMDGSDEDAATFRSMFGPNTTPEDLVTTFLQGTGIPCEVQWAALTGGGRLQDVPSPEMLETPSFRPRMLAWAMTGMLHLPGAAHNLQVSTLLTYPIWPY